jgi:hypothetical protein
MRISHHFLIYPLALILLLASTLIATVSTAQQPGIETPVVILEEPGPTAEADAGQAIPGPENADPANTPATTRFTPTEKIHADNAVSFPVDI